MRWNFQQSGARRQQKYNGGVLLACNILSFLTSSHRPTGSVLLGQLELIVLNSEEYLHIKTMLL